MTKQRIAAILISVVVAMVPRDGVTADGVAADGAVAAPATTAPSTTAPAATVPAYEARALIQAVSEVTLASEISGRIDTLPHREGGRFAKGDTLIRFDCRAYEARLQVVKAALKIANLTLDTVRKRAALGSVGSLEVGTAEADVDKAKGEVAAADFPVDRCHIRAPFDGRVVELAAHLHETVAVGVPMMHIIDDQNLEVKIVVPSLWLAWLNVGSAFDIEIDETGETLRGRVTRLGALVDAVGQSIPAFAVLDAGSDKLIAGMSGSVRFKSPSVVQGAP